MEEGERRKSKGQCLSLHHIDSDQETSRLPPFWARDRGPLSSAFCGRPQHFADVLMSHSCL